VRFTSKRRATVARQRGAGWHSSPATAADRKPILILKRTIAWPE
jgi:hypothetical protein